MKDCVAWAAGFLEGEGSFGFYNGSPAVQAPQVNREPLERLVRVLGGKIGGPYGPYRRSTNHEPIWRWRLGGAKALSAIFVLWPWLSEKRRTQAQRALAGWARTEVARRSGFCYLTSTP